MRASLNNGNMLSEPAFKVLQLTAKEGKKTSMNKVCTHPISRFGKMAKMSQNRKTTFSMKENYEFCLNTHHAARGANAA
jgi:hypothetical protein